MDTRRKGVQPREAGESEEGNSRGLRRPGKRVYSWGTKGLGVEEWRGGALGRRDKRSGRTVSREDQSEASEPYGERTPDGDTEGRRGTGGG